jgi:hypothetical protein
VNAFIDRIMRVPQQRLIIRVLLWFWVVNAVARFVAAIAGVLPYTTPALVFSVFSVAAGVPALVVAHRYRPTRRP